MAAASKDRDTVQEGRHNQDVHAFPAKVGTYYAGTMVSTYLTTEAGRIAPSAASGSTTAARVVGVVDQQTVIATQGDTVLCKQGPHWFDNSSGAGEITLDDVNKLCYAVDNQTVSLVHTDTLHPAGRILAVLSGTVGVPARGVMVDIGYGILSGSV